jgi:hypothetical protein
MGTSASSVLVALGETAGGKKLSLRVSVACPL